jgi:hypothetical protein
MRLTLYLSTDPRLERVARLEQATMTNQRSRLVEPARPGVALLPLGFLQARVEASQSGRNGQSEIAFRASARFP